MHAYSACKTSDCGDNMERDAKKNMRYKTLLYIILIASTVFAAW